MIMFPHETADTFFRRRKLHCAKKCKQAGEWGQFVCMQFAKWADHVSRRASYPNQPWLVSLTNWHGQDWLTSQRAGRGGSHAGTGTRVLSGRPPTRWDEAARYARANRCKRVGPSDLAGTTAGRAVTQT